VTKLHGRTTVTVRGPETKATPLPCPAGGAWFGHPVSAGHDHADLPPRALRCPNVPAESRTLGLTHLQFEALLSCARESTNQFDFALVTMLGLLGLRISEATDSDIEDFGEEQGPPACRSRAANSGPNSTGGCSGLVASSSRTRQRWCPVVGLFGLGYGRRD